jgi:hypothetical protein
VLKYHPAFHLLLPKGGAKTTAYHIRLKPPFTPLHKKTRRQILVFIEILDWVLAGLEE